MIIVGANPVRALKDLEECGRKLYGVDPRRTETAKVAGEHIFIRPGTDVFFYLAFLHELANIGGINRDRVQKYMKGLDEVLTIETNSTLSHGFWSMMFGC